MSELALGRVLRKRLREIDEVATDVNAVLVGSAEPRRSE